MSGSVRTSAVEECFIAGSESYLSPVASLPLGASSTSAAPLLAGFGGQRLAVFLRDGAAGPGHTAHLTGLEPSSTGGRALQDVKGKEELN